MQKMVRKILRAVADYDPDYYDMHDDPDEAFFAPLYLERLKAHAAAAGIRPPSTVLDAGCQAGRLLVPLAQAGFQLTGIDTSRFALRRARRHARAAGIQASFIQGDILDVLQQDAWRQYDMVVCAEVLYLVERYHAMLAALAAAGKPGGLLCVSHRPQQYFLLEALRHRHYTTAHLVLTATEGRFEGPFPEKGYYNWQTAQSLRQMYKGLGLEWVALYPIDRYAWLSGMAPSQLTDQQRDAWLQRELEPVDEADTCARYVLVVARRPE